MGDLDITLKRDNQRLKRIRQMACIRCAMPAPSQACHSNFHEHGKGMGTKADDRYTIPLCYSCHRWLDTYQEISRNQAKDWFMRKLFLVNKVLDEQNKPTETF